MNSIFGQHSPCAPSVLGSQPCRIRLQPKFRPHPTISPIKTSNAIRVCSRAKSCAEPQTGNDSKNNLAATSGISVDSGPALRQNFKNHYKRTLHQYSVFSATFATPPSAPHTPLDAPQQFFLSPRSCFPYCKTHPDWPLFSRLSG